MKRGFRFCGRVKATDPALEPMLTGTSLVLRTLRRVRNCRGGRGSTKAVEPRCSTSLAVFRPPACLHYNPEVWVPRTSSSIADGLLNRLRMNDFRCEHWCCQCLEKDGRSLASLGLDGPCWAVRHQPHRRDNRRRPETRDPETLANWALHRIPAQSRFFRVTTAYCGSSVMRAWGGQRMRGLIPLGQRPRSSTACCPPT